MCHATQVFHDVHTTYALEHVKWVSKLNTQLKHIQLDWFNRALSDYTGSTRFNEFLLTGYTSSTHLHTEHI